MNEQKTTIKKVIFHFYEWKFTKPLLIDKKKRLVDRAIVLGSDDGKKIKPTVYQFMGHSGDNDDRGMYDLNYQGCLQHPKYWCWPDGHLGDFEKQSSGVTNLMIEWEE